MNQLLLFSVFTASCLWARSNSMEPSLRRMFPKWMSADCSATARIGSAPRSPYTARLHGIGFSGRVKLSKRLPLKIVEFWQFFFNSIHLFSIITKQQNTLKVRTYVNQIICRRKPRVHKTSLELRMSSINDEIFRVQGHFAMHASIHKCIHWSCCQLNCIICVDSVCLGSHDPKMCVIIRMWNLTAFQLNSSLDLYIVHRGCTFSWINLVAMVLWVHTNKVDISLHVSRMISYDGHIISTCRSWDINSSNRVFDDELPAGVAEGCCMRCRWLQKKLHPDGHLDGRWSGLNLHLSISEMFLGCYKAISRWAIGLLQFPYGEAHSSGWTGQRHQNPLMYAPKKVM